jgi:hypothetical protein
VLRRATPRRRQLAQACLLFFAAGAAILIVSDAFQFSWRYQLPALVTVPPAGALGIAVLISYLRGGRRPDEVANQTDATELASPAV